MTPRTWTIPERMAACRELIKLFQTLFEIQRQDSPIGHRIEEIAREHRAHMLQEQVRELARFSESIKRRVEKRWDNKVEKIKQQLKELA